MSNKLNPTPQHWIDKLTTDLIANWPDVQHFNCNCGISVSGQQHVGRLRGEIILTNAVVNEIKERGCNATHSLILYTADPWKGKKNQLNCFSDPDEAKKYINWRLIDVPDPTNQFTSWVDYFWRAFGDPLPNFGRNIEIVRTHEFYQNEDMKKTIIELIDKKEQVRTILNKYRKDNPFPENWIPFNPMCTHCNRIGTTTALEVNLEEYRVHYYCNTCQKDDWSDMRLGKLTWRLEWLAIWYVLQVHFEPYGKDHATPGGSRDSCIEVLQNVLQYRGPYGFWNEWVGYSEGRTDLGDMSSSGFIGFTPVKWLKYSEVEVLKYINLKPPPKRRIVLGLDKIPSYVAEYDKAQRIYYNLEPFDDNAELQNIRRSYEIVFYNDPPQYRGFQLDYLHAIILSQLVPQSAQGIKQAINKLQATEILTSPLTRNIEQHIQKRLTQARNWVSDYAPAHLRISIPEEVPKTIITQTDEKIIGFLQNLVTELASIKWTEEEIKQTMISLRESLKLSRKDMARFFKVLYQIFLGRSQGPRFAPFIAALEKEWVISRMKEAIFILIGELYMESSDSDSHTPSPPPKSISPWNIILAVVLAPLTSFFMVFFFTSAVDFISREQWSLLPIIWPPAIYLGGIIGGTVGGFLAFWEVRQNLDSSSSLKQAQLFTQDLLYLGLLAILTYILEILSESIILQALLFILEIACFIVIGRNIGRLTLKISATSEDSNDLKEDSEL